jgi:hypothetical protein
MTEARIAMNKIGSILGTVHALGMPFLKDSEVSCESPLCDIRFPQTGLKMEPRRFCSDKCKQQASLIRRVAALLVPLGKEKAWEALSKTRGYPMACNCSESKTHGVPNNLHKHNCEYIAFRNSRLDEAMAFADRKASRSEALWTRVFIRRMEEQVRGNLHDKEPAPAPVVQQSALLQAMLDANRFSHAIRPPQAESVSESVGVSDE